MLPQAHLLMQIVVKQDQVEVQLQAPQRPLLDSMLGATLLRMGGEGGRETWGVKRGAALQLCVSSSTAVLPGWKSFPVSIPFAVVYREHRTLW